MAPERKHIAEADIDRGLGLRGQSRPHGREHRRADATHRVTAAAHVVEESGAADVEILDPEGNAAGRCQEGARGQIGILAAVEELDLLLRLESDVHGNRKSAGATDLHVLPGRRVAEITSRPMAAVQGEPVLRTFRAPQGLRLREPRETCRQARDRKKDGCADKACRKRSVAFHGNAIVPSPHRRTSHDDYPLPLGGAGANVAGGTEQGSDALTPSNACRFSATARQSLEHARIPS